MKLVNMALLDVLSNIKEELICNLQEIIPDTVVEIQSDYSDLFFDLSIEIGSSKSIILEIFIKLRDNTKGIFEIMINNKDLLKLYSYQIFEFTIEECVFQIYKDFIYNYDV